MALLDGKDEGGISLRVAGVPVRVQPSFFVMAVLMASGRGDPALAVVWIAVVFLSILAHELGHAAAYRAFGKQPRIVLYAMGGLTSGEPVGAWREVVVCLAGPGVGFVLGALTWLVDRATASQARGLLVEVALGDLLWANVGWGLVNLLPILPLDGAQAARAIVRTFREKWADGPMRAVSAVTGLAACGFALSRHMTWAAFLAGWLAFENGRAFVRGVRDGRDRRALGPLLDEGYEKLDDDAPGAETIGREILRRATTDDMRWRARHLVASALTSQDKPDAAVDVLAACDAPDPWVLGRALAKAGRHAEAVPHLERALERQPGDARLAFLVATLVRAGKLDAAMARAASSPAPVPDWAERALGAALFYAGRYEESHGIHARLFARAADPDDAYNIACCLAKCGKPEEAVTWLGRAVDAGYVDQAHLMGDEDLAELRGRDDFRSVAARMNPA